MITQYEKRHAWDTPLHDVAAEIVDQTIREFIQTTNSFTSPRGCCVRYVTNTV